MMEDVKAFCSTLLTLTNEQTKQALKPRRSFGIVSNDMLFSSYSCRESIAQITCEFDFF